MKRIIQVVLALLILVGCTDSKSKNDIPKEVSKPAYNEQQALFCEQFKKYVASYRGRANDALIPDIDKTFENYLDSTGLFIGWKGIISDIKTETVMEHPSFYYEIRFNLPHSSTITLKGYNYMNSEKEIQDSYIFNKIKNIKNGSTVYFDGIITRNNNGEVRYGIMDDEKKFTSPGYDFIAVDIYTSEPDSLSVLLKEANEKSLEVALYSRKMINKEISEREWNKRMNRIGKIRLKNKKEAEYNERYSEALMRYMF